MGKKTFPKNATECTEIQATGNSFFAFVQCNLLPYGTICSSFSSEAEWIYLCVNYCVPKYIY